MKNYTASEGDSLIEMQGESVWPKVWFAAFIALCLIVAIHIYRLPGESDENVMIKVSKPAATQYIGRGVTWVIAETKISSVHGDTINLEP